MSLKKLGLLFLSATITLLFVTEAPAKRRLKDEESRKIISRSLKKEEEKKQKTQKKLKVKKKEDKKKIQRKQNKEVKKALKRNKSSLKKQTPDQQPVIIKVPQVYMVRVKDLPKDQKTRAEKCFNHGLKYDSSGWIKFSHSNLNTPSFKDFLDLMDQERKSKSSHTFKTYEYTGSTKEVSQKKRTKWTFPWSR